MLESALASRQRRRKPTKSDVAWHRLDQKDHQRADGEGSLLARSLLDVSLLEKGRVDSEGEVGRSDRRRRG